MEISSFRMNGPPVAFMGREREKKRIYSVNSIRKDFSGFKHTNIESIGSETFSLLGIESNQLQRKKLKHKITL